jgi:hypothetical protein
MKDLNEFKKQMEVEIDSFKKQINPTMNNSPKEGKKRIDDFMEILPKVENLMNNFSKKYFEGEPVNSSEMEQIKTINKELYQGFIDYCKIPTISRKG